MTIKHNLRSQIAFTAAAIVLGAALAPAAAFAQARNVNDGGQVVVAPGAKLNSGSKPAAGAQSYYGRSPDDGGTGPQPTSAQVTAATPKPTRTLHLQAGTPAPAAPGRSVNDGGPTN